MSSPTLIDDTNPIVQYEAGWIWDQNVNEVDGTRHGAGIAGITASLSFAGTGVQVVGTLESSDHSGQPTTSYAIDGETVGTYTAPFTPSGQTHYNVTFFSKPDLSSGDHEIVITNVNGTSPNVFWLDYFLVDAAPPSSGGGTTSSSSTSTSTSTSVTPSDSLSSTVITVVSTSTYTFSTTSSQGVGLPPSSPSNLSSYPSSSSSSSSSAFSFANLTATPFSDTTNTLAQGSLPTSATAAPTTSGVGSTTPGAVRSSDHSNTHAIIGGVVGGVIFLALLIPLFFWWRRRQQRSLDDVDPFIASARDHTWHSGTLASTGFEFKPSKVPEMSLTATTASPTAFRQTVSLNASELPAAHPSEHGSPTVTLGDTPAAPTTLPSHQSPGSPAGPLHTDVKLQDAVPSIPLAAAQSEPHIDHSPVSPSSPHSAAGSASASEYALSEAPITPAPADAEASRAPWYAPPQRESRAHSLLRVLSSRNRPVQQQPTHDVDSGLRLYNEPTLPPPYTPD
ncbi:hypothetical protein BD311DRAFT_822526 [Dichomitus squalens]|uniref:Uncharacterized protein n=1 Tax=Dichomitus squalens TaxID=114155 RepID=A0A4Q9M6Y6_9APHY|nr:hypothetical protein BD311DRAFT_822526 [Dichomitus squalens]